MTTCSNCNQPIPHTIDVCIAALRNENSRLNLNLLDASMLVRRFCCRAGRLDDIPLSKLRDQAEDWIKRKGLQGSVLREDTTP